MSDDQHILWMRDLETQIRVERDGRDPTCGNGCRMVGKQCPDTWCEAVYQKVKVVPIIKHPSALRRIWDWLWKPWMSPAGFVLAAIVAEILRKVFP